MAEKRKGYEITDDLKELESFIRERMESEEGMTEKDELYIKENYSKNAGELKAFFNNLGKLIANYSMEADTVKAEADILKDEVERLVKRAKARERAVDGLYNYATFLMSEAKIKEMKTELFSYRIQNTQKSVKVIAGFFNINEMPDEYVKKELIKSKISEAVKSGKLFIKTDEEVEKNPLLKGKLFFKDGKELKGISYTGGQSLVIR